MLAAVLTVSGAVVPMVTFITVEMTLTIPPMTPM
jgi:hypothetical protein